MAPGPDFAALAAKVAAVDRQLLAHIGGEDLAAAAVVLIERAELLNQMETAAAEDPQPGYLALLGEVRDSGTHILRHLIRMRHGIAAALSSASASRHLADSLGAGAPPAASVGLDCKG